MSGVEVNGDAWETDWATKLLPISRPDLGIRSSASIDEGAHLTSVNSHVR